MPWYPRRPGAVQSKMLRRQAEERLAELRHEVEAMAASRQQPQGTQGGSASLQSRLQQAIVSIQEGLVERDTEVRLPSCRKPSTPEPCWRSVAPSALPAVQLPDGLNAVVPRRSGSSCWQRSVESIFCSSGRPGRQRASSADASRSSMTASSSSGCSPDSLSLRCAA